MSFNYYLYFLYFQLALETSKYTTRGPDTIELNTGISFKVKSCGLQGGHEPSLFPGRKGNKYPAGLLATQQTAGCKKWSFTCSQICGTDWEYWIQFWGPQYKEDWLTWASSKIDVRASDVEWEVDSEADVERLRRPYCHLWLCDQRTQRRGQTPIAGSQQ